MECRMCCNMCISWQVSGCYQVIFLIVCRLRLKCDDTRAETRYRLSAKRTSPFKSAGASVQLTTGSRGVCISGSNAGYTIFQGSVKSTGYPLHSPVSPSLPLPYVTVCHHISTGLYHLLGYDVTSLGIHSSWNPIPENIRTQRFFETSWCNYSLMWRRSARERKVSVSCIYQGRPNRVPKICDSGTVQGCW